MSGILRVRFFAASLVLSLFAVAAAPTHARLARLAVPATTLAPANPIPVDLRLDILGVLPDDVYGFVTAHHLLDTKETVENVLRKLGIPFDAEDDYAEFEEFLEELKGWDEQATHAVALFPVEGQTEPEVAVFVPVKNYKMFAASLGAAGSGETPTEFKGEGSRPKGWIAAKGNYAVLTDEGDDGRALLERIQTSKKSLTEARGPLRKWIGEYQVAVVVTRVGTDKILDEAIKGLAALKQEFKNNADADIAATAGQAAIAFEMYETILKSMREDVTHLAFGGLLSEKAGLRLAGEALFAPNGKFAAATKEFTPLPVDALNGLPDDRYFVAGAGTLPTQLVESMMSLSFGMFKDLPKEQGGLLLTPEQQRKITQASLDMVKGVKNFSMSYNAAGDGLLGGAVALYKVDDSAAFLKRYEAALKVTQEVTDAVDSPLLAKQQLEHRKIDGLDVLAVTMDLSKQLDQAGAGQPEPVKQIVRAMFGGNGTITGFMIAADDKTVLMTYDSKVLTDTLKDFKAGKIGLGGNPNLQKTAAMFPQPLHAVGYLSVGGAIDVGKKMANAVMAAQGQGGFPFPIPPFPETAPLGFATRVNGNALEGHFVVPMDLMEGVRDYVNQVTQMFGGGR